MRIIIRVVVFIALLIAVGWVFFEPNFEPSLTLTLVLATFLGTFIGDKTQASPPRQNQVVSNNSKAVQVGRDSITVHNNIEEKECFQINKNKK